MALPLKQVVINFNVNEGALNVSIETPRLFIRSVEACDIKNYLEIFSDAKAMSKYASGYPILDESIIRERVERWIEGWHHNDTFNGMAVFAKKPKVYIGHIIVGHSDIGEGIAELAYIFHKKFWGKHLGSEAVEAIVRHFIPQIMLKGYTLGGHPLEGIIATARIDNIASQKMLRALNFKINKSLIKEKWGYLRYTYYIKASALLAQYQYMIYRKSRLGYHFLRHKLA